MASKQPHGEKPVRQILRNDSVARLKARVKALEAAQREAQRTQGVLLSTAKALRESEERYALAMRGPNEGLWDWNPITKELYLSARLLSILGFESETLRTTSHEWLKLVHPGDRGRYQSTLVRHLKGIDAHFECEYRVSDRQGQWRWMLARGLAVRGPDGVATRMVGSIGDVTERHAYQRALKEANERLEQRVAERTEELEMARQQAEEANRCKSEFLANMSHELRTPLNAIIGFSDVMRTEVFGPVGNPRYGEYIASVWESGNHLLSIINDILDLAKVEVGKFDLGLEPADVAQLLEAAARLVSERAARAEVRLEWEAAPDLGAVSLDPLRMKQVLLNLLSNAVKFTPAGGVVRLCARREAADLVIDVSDTGIGMDEDSLEKAMQPFVQVESSLSRRYAGTGLGLPLAKSFVELHGGRLILASRPGHGTTVTVRIPIH
ncbi:Signal transduction histidine kinase [Paramagnetospirillum caucaseum]|uniref:histidine kinase n=1 Tax=Paramagnetospirillum caucaseum TaxID=1244869 RepID=M3A652_9PROT|nr:PAS domain-containing hybrid sensor histidine kinase/response regulator [Paramagnetospirillum caucaseum]EME68278.1 Signal transduction histidine kinase [Paramagnetospirillum caucaseum]